MDKLVQRGSALRAIHEVLKEPAENRLSIYLGIGVDPLEPGSDTGALCPEGVLVSGNTDSQEQRSQFFVRVPNLEGSSYLPDDLGRDSRTRRLLPLSDHCLLGLLNAFGCDADVTTEGSPLNQTLPHEVIGDAARLVRSQAKGLSYLSSGSED